MQLSRSMLIDRPADIDEIYGVSVTERIRYRFIEHFKSLFLS